jgi:hypothetical protein
MTGRGATLTVETSQGTEAYTVTSVSGDPGMPLSADDVRDKAITYMSPTVGAAGANEITDAILTGTLDSPLPA